MNWRLIIVLQTALAGISAAFAYLSAEMDTDAVDQEFLSLRSPANMYIYNIALNLICNSLTCLFFVIVTARIRMTLRKAAEFLRQLSCDRAHADTYDRISRFSFLICTVFGQRPR